MGLIAGPFRIVRLCRFSEAPMLPEGPGEINHMKKYLLKKKRALKIVEILSAGNGSPDFSIIHRREENVNKYELTVILRINESLESNREKVKAILQKNGANVVSEDVWGNRRLAYMLDGQNDGNYTLMNIEAPPEAIQKITGEFRLNGDILRHLFVRVPAARTA